MSTSEILTFNCGNICKNNINIEKAFSEINNNFTHLKMMTGRNPIFDE